ncbi:hypothetical protein BDC45DRAFT_535983 [Circinella umbellata]|nr:hypothetical protein BDC45DRAFT_535983 [Circinella umbellata]
MVGIKVVSKLGRNFYSYVAMIILIVDTYLRTEGTGCKTNEDVVNKIIHEPTSFTLSNKLIAMPFRSEKNRTDKHFLLKDYLTSYTFPLYIVGFILNNGQAIAVTAGWAIGYLAKVRTLETLVVFK